MKNNFDLYEIVEYLYYKYPKRFTVVLFGIAINLFCVMYVGLDLIDKYL